MIGLFGKIWFGNSFLHVLDICIFCFYCIFFLFANICINVRLRDGSLFQYFSFLNIVQKGGGVKPMLKKCPFS